MYRILIVDDEPTALNLLRMIIDKRSEGFEVSDIAYNGLEALEKIEKIHPDVVITDIQMPVMSGLELIEKAQERIPDLASIVISGYQEFEYVKTAMRFGVSDYILKPIVPSELCEILKKIKIHLDTCYCRNRNILMHRLVNDIPVEKSELKKYFKDDDYYGAIVRRNALPTRFTEREQKEIFSDIHELMLTYGRDDQETLYLCPKKILCGRDYVKMIEKQIGKEQPDAAYLTTVICKKEASVSQMGTMIRKLYRTLDSSVVIGKNQTVLLEDSEAFEDWEDKENFEYLQELEFLAKNQKYERLQKEIEQLIEKWGQEEQPQIWMEGRLRQICYLLRRYGAGSKDYRECEFLLDEAFANAENIEQLITSTKDIFFKDKKEECMVMQRLNTEEYFQRIRTYIHIHMREAITLQSVSRDMGVSQTYLSRLFRKYEKSSFNTYLTTLRMEKAKKLLLSEQKIFVKDVAEEVGYKDQFYFSRIFYSYTGVRPSEYTEE